MKIVVNRCFGGFSLSPAVMAELGLPDRGRFGFIYPSDLGMECEDYEGQVALRSHPRLIAAIEKVGVKEASGALADLEIVEVPDNPTSIYIDEYDGRESVVWSMSEIHTA